MDSSHPTLLYSDSCPIVSCIITSVVLYECTLDIIRTAMMLNFMILRSGLVLETYSYVHDIYHVMANITILHPDHQDDISCLPPWVGYLHMIGAAYTNVWPSLLDFTKYSTSCYCNDFLIKWKQLKKQDIIFIAINMTIICRLCRHHWQYNFK